MMGHLNCLPSGYMTHQKTKAMKKENLEEACSYAASPWSQEPATKRLQNPVGINCKFKTIHIQMD
jgi:hypothetical protein